MYGAPLETREPGKAAKTAQVGLAVGATTAAATGSIIGAVATGPFAPIGAAVGGLVGGILGLAAGLINPERAAMRTSMMQQGLSREYASSYAKYAAQPDSYLIAEAGRLADKAAAGNRKALDELAAIRTIRAERASDATVAQAAALAAQPRTGAVPLWAPAAFLAILAVGGFLAWRRKR